MAKKQTARKRKRDHPVVLKAKQAREIADGLRVANRIIKRLIRAGVIAVK